MVYSTHKTFSLNDCLGYDILPKVRLIVEPKYFGFDILPSPCFLMFNQQLNLSLLGLASCQAQFFLGLTGGWTLTCWVWCLARLMFPWVQHIIEPKFIGFDIPSDLSFIGFGRWLNSNKLGMTSFQAHVSLSLAYSWIQVYRVWHITRLKLYRVRLIVEPKCFKSSIMLDLCHVGFS